MAADSPMFPPRRGLHHGHCPPHLPDCSTPWNRIILEALLIPSRIPTIPSPEASIQPTAALPALHHAAEHAALDLDLLAGVRCGAAHRDCLPPPSALDSRCRVFGERRQQVARNQHDEHSVRHPTSLKPTSPGTRSRVCCVGTRRGPLHRLHRGGASPWDRSSRPAQCPRGPAHQLPVRLHQEISKSCDGFSGPGVLTSKGTEITKCETCDTRQH